MDKVVVAIEGFSGDDDNLLKQLQTELKKNEDLIQRNLNQVDAALLGLDVSRHSLGVLHLLAAKSKQSNIEPDLFINQCVPFLTSCTTKQIRHDPRKFRLVCQRFTEVCRDSKQPIRAIKPLKQAIWKIGLGELLTPQHYMYVQACLKAKCYKAAASVLDNFVYEIDPELTGIESVDTRLYFYYGGMAYIGLKKFQKAIEFLEIVISAPALVASAIMVEAYKKYVLISLIEFGQVGTPPKYTSHSVLRFIKQCSIQYDEFATSYSTRSIVDLNKVVANHTDFFIKDGTLGLVKQAVQALYRQNIQRLTKTYLTLSLQDISDQVGLTGERVQEAEKRIYKMIEQGEIYAKINQKDGMIQFYESPELFNTNKTLNYLDRQIHQTIDLTKKVTKIDEQISLNTKYLQKVIQAERGTGVGGGVGGGGVGPGGRFIGNEDEEVSMAVEKSFATGPGGFRG
eukprot:TRINITY_DN1608_c0_g1_i1.p1 TRINITY_DN1608_c0_g1~~TRINITY_DN1608_c0_g1_i1.p1  ORF type:complete len:455 (+),score=102.21 TRINITY_DN1608_c0_g1_i1:283-1647(+)